MKKIFVVDDEKKIRDLIHLYLKKDGYSVKTFSNAKDTLEEFRQNEPDLMILDIMMDDMDGLDLCRQIRLTSDVPIIFVSARGEEIDKILGLELGADDYLAKPFSPRELITRVKIILKRVSKSNHKNLSKKENELVIFNYLEMNPSVRIAKYNGREVPFTSKEFDVLIYLIENIDKPLSRNQILTKVWGSDSEDERNVDDTIKRVRKKLRQYNLDVNIKAVWGYGYRIDTDE